MCVNRGNVEENERVKGSPRLKLNLGRRHPRPPSNLCPPSKSVLPYRTFIVFVFYVEGRLLFLLHLLCCVCIARLNRTLRIERE